MRFMLHHSYILNPHTVLNSVVCCLDHLIKPPPYRYANIKLLSYLLSGSGTLPPVTSATMLIWLCATQLTSQRYEWWATLFPTSLLFSLLEYIVGLG